VASEKQSLLRSRRPSRAASLLHEHSLQSQLQQLLASRPAPHRPRRTGPHSRISSSNSSSLHLQRLVLQPLLLWEGGSSLEFRAEAVLRASRRRQPLPLPP
jgi:hypothetical protein